MSDASKRRDSSWDIRNAPRNYISLVLFQVGSALFSFGAVWLITRHLGSEGYGGIIAIIAASQVAQILVNWTSVAVVRFGVDEFIETEKIARTFWLIFLVLAANLIIVAALSSFWFPPLADWLKLRPESFWLVMTHFTVTALWIHVQMSLQGAKNAARPGLFADDRAAHDFCRAFCSDSIGVAYAFVGDDLLYRGTGGRNDFGDFPVEKIHLVTLFGRSGIC